MNVSKTWAASEQTAATQEDIDHSALGQEHGPMQYISLSHILKDKYTGISSDIYDERFLYYMVNWNNQN